MNEERKRFLLVEDDKSARGTFRRYFDYCPEYELSIASSVREAEELGDLEFDIAIIDGLEGNCFDLLPRLNAKRKVIYTGSDYIYQRAKEKGLEVYMKPIVEFSKWLKKLATLETDTSKSQEA